MTSIFMVLLHIGIFLFAIYMLYFVLIEQYKSTYIRKKCKCGEHEKCISELEITWLGRLKHNNMFNCDEVKRKIKDFNVQ